jgi:tetratricopeptide (TPR) repeat protein
MRGRSPAVQEMFAGALQHQGAGRLDEAGRLYRQILALDPCDADSLHCLGVIAHKTGRDDLAVDMISQAITINGADPSYHFNLGNLLRKHGRADEAAACYRKALELRPDYPQAFNTRGKALRRLQRPAEALEAYDKALVLKPDYAEALNNRGNALGDLNRPAEALASYDRALALEPDYIEALNNRGNALRALDRPAEALASYDRALARRPDDAGVIVNRGNALRDLNRPAEALASYDRALALKPDYPEVFNNRGAALRDLDRPAEALASFDRALALKSDFADAFCNKGIVLTELGRFDQANVAIERAAEIVPRSARYHYILAISKRSAVGDRNLQAMEELARDMRSLGMDDQIYLHFALGKALADIGDHERSFRHVLEGNRLKRSQMFYDEAATFGLFERTRAAFTGDVMRRVQGVGEVSSVPVFILGMPRSGSTLVEQILASHPAVFGAGEIEDFEKAVMGVTGAKWGFLDANEITSLASRDEFRRLGTDYLNRIRASAPEAERITNKTPENFRFIGLIHLALPNARIIHTRRDAIDTCLSCFEHWFVRRLQYTYNLGELGRYYNAYEAMMAHWRAVLPQNVMLDLDYEELVADPEGQARRIVAHCGLEWDARCLDFHRTERVVRTASTSQVRRPVYKSSVGRWRALAPFLGPLLAELRASGASATPAPTVCD